MQAARRIVPTGQQSSPGRGKMIAAIQIQWRNLRPDLHHDEEELRAERLAFITDVLKLKRPLVSLRALSTAQLGRVLDALRLAQAQPVLGGYTPPVKPQPEGADVIHLASREQVFTIDKLLDHLNWSSDFRQSFIRDRFKRDTPSMLAPTQAHALIRILLNIAAGREAKILSGGKPASRAFINSLIPELKRRLEIDRKD